MRSHEVRIPTYISHGYQEHPIDESKSYNILIMDYLEESLKVVGNLESEGGR